MKRLMAALAVVLLASACTSHRLNQFQSFSSAGTEYTEAMVTLTQEAGKVAIDADSEILLKILPDVNREDRRKRYQEHTQALSELLTTLGDLRRHTTLLKEYFSILNALSSSETGPQISEASAGVIDKLSKISPGLKEAQIGDVTIKSAVETVSGLVVGHFQVEALEKELRRNSETIANELTLQEAVLSALATEMRADLKTITSAKAFTDVAKPYVEAEAIADLPEDWRKRRREVLSTYVAMASVDNAAQAAGKLRKTFVMLVKQEVEPGTLASLFEDINAILEVIETAQNQTAT